MISKRVLSGIIVATALLASSSSAIADAWNDAENACALAATAIVTGVRIGNTAEQIAVCNNHPDKKSCLSTLSFISENADVPPELTCHELDWRRYLRPRKAKDRVALPEPDLATRRAEDACARAATTLITHAVVGDLAKDIALCNKHPQRDACRATQSFVSQNNGGKVPAELTCQ
jgi:hypothetical protein